MTKIYITVDAEWDRKKDKKQISTKNLDKTPRFQKLCTQNNIKPIYFCTYEALENKNFVTYLKPFINKNKIEIGAHLHPWTTPPFVLTNKNYLTPFPTQFTLDIFEKKLQNLTRKITNAFDFKPISYRAGRFGFSYKHIPILKQNGYLIDSSITPLVNWNNLHPSAPDYRYFKNADKTKISYNNIEIHEFPITILPNKSYTFKNIAKRLLTNNPIWFRIYPTTYFSDLKYIINYAEKNNIKHLTFFMHSNELDYKNNTYFKSKEQIEKLYLLLTKLFNYINKKKCISDIFANQIKL